MSSDGGSAGADSPKAPSWDGRSAEWRRVYDRVEAQLEVLAAGLAQLEALNGILHEYGDARDNINLARIHQVELSRSRWEAACKELLPADSPKLTELLTSDLDDSRTCAALFNIENSELKIRLKELGTCVEISENTADHEKFATDLKAELRKLKHGYETLCANHAKTVSTLLAEKDFVWNQLRAMEKDKAALLGEGAQATEATQNLQKKIEELQLAARNKDAEIRKLQAEALAAKSKLLVAEGKLDEMHSLTKEKDIQILKDGQSQSLERKPATLPNLRGMEKDNTALLKIKEVEGEQATEATHKLHQVAARDKDGEIRILEADPLASINKLLVAEGKPDEIKKPKDGQLKSLKRKRTSLPNASPDLENASSPQIVPILGMNFQSEEEAYEFYNSYARTKGFSITKMHKKHRRADDTLCSRYMVCSAHKKTCCLARVQFTISREGIWIIQKVVLDHNHGLVTPDESAPLKPTFQAGQQDIVAAQQPPMKTEGGNGHEDFVRHRCGPTEVDAERMIKVLSPPPSQTSPPFSKAKFPPPTRQQGPPIPHQI